MMSVKEYALDINVTVEAVIKKAQELGYDIKNADDMLDEDQIIDLDNTLTMNVNEEEEPEYIDEITEEKDYDLDAELEDKAEELASASHIRFDDTVKKQKLKKKSEVQKEDMHAKRKQMYKNKEKLMQNEASHDDNIIVYKEGMTVSELAKELNVNPTEVIKKLMNLGIMASLNNSLSYDDVEMIVIDYDKTLKSFESQDKTNFEKFEVNDDPASLVDRPAVVTIMGHVDHGKTSLLDYIRNSHITTGEFGGITQHIGAYQIEKNGKKITFIDTPGHEAFTEMRARGAAVTDIVIIIVAADDGVMPQTEEAIDHAKAAGVPIIVAINKMDKEGANPERVMEQLTEQGLVPEEWGGDVICVPVSAKTGMGIDKLLETILLVSEMCELKANPNRAAKGVVIEAKLDKGRGPIATFLVQNGTLKSGDYVVAGTAVGRVRAMTDYRGRKLNSAGPSVPVEIMGLDQAPMSGDEFNAVTNEKLARQLVEQRKEEAKEEEFKQFHKVTLDTLFSTLEEGQMKELNIIIKADVQGSVEAVKQSLLKIENDEVRVRIIHGAVGAVNDSDVMLANASNAIIVAFATDVEQVAADNASRDGIEIKQYSIIYDLIEDIESAMRGMRSVKYRNVDTGTAEVREVYTVSSVGSIAGSLVTSGTIRRNGKIRVMRNGKQLADTPIKNLKRFKDDVKDVSSGYECGISLENWNDIKPGDIFECYVVEEYRD